MILDLETLVITELTIVTFSIILFSTIKKNVPYKNAMNALILCHCSSFTAFILLSLQGVLPDFFTIVLQNILFVYPYSLFLKGVKLVFNKKENNFVEYIFPLFMLPFMIYFTYINDSLTHRNEVFSIFNLFYHALIIITISKEKFIAKWLIICAYLFSSFVFVLELFGSQYLTSNRFFDAGILIELESWSSIIVLLATILFILTAIFEKMMKELDENLKREKKIKSSLEKSNRFKIDFIANVSHELRTPLSGIIGNAELLKLKKKNSAELVNIMNLSKHLLTLINQLIDFAKIEKKKIQVENSEFSLRVLLDEISNIFNKKLSDKEVLLLIYVDKKIPEKITGDYIKIKQVLINIVGNAVKFTDSGKIEINITCIGFSTNNIQIKFEVIDTGIGIDTDTSKRIFNSFEQGEIDLNKKYEGTGLGLTISQNFVKLMGGKIEVESKINKGSRFYFDLAFNSFVIQNRKIQSSIYVLITNNKIIIEFLSKYFLNYEAPYIIVNNKKDIKNALNKKDINNATIILCEDLYDRYRDDVNLTDTAKVYLLTSKEHYKKDYFYKIINLNFNNIIDMFYLEEKDIKKEDNTEEQTFNGLSSLIVDDSIVNIEIMKEYLQHMKISTESATSGKRCLDLVKEKEFNIIFLDIQLPKLNGFKVLEMLKKIIRNKTLIIAFTASGGEEFKEKCINAGFDGVLGKPFYFDELLAMLNKYFPNNNILNEVIDEYLQNEGNKPVLNEDYLSILIQSIEEDINQLKKDIETLNFEGIKSFAHKKKGAALQINQNNLANILQNIEEAVIRENISTIKQLFKELISEIESLGREIKC